MCEVTQTPPGSQKLVLAGTRPPAHAHASHASIPSAVPTAQDGDLLTSAMGLGFGEPGLPEVPVPM